MTSFLTRIPGRLLTPSRYLALCGALSMAGSLTAQFSADSFEAHRYALGTLPGGNMWTGQDGWLQISAAGSTNLAATTVQDSDVRSGGQAVRFDASQLAPGAIVELRRNALFPLVSGVLEIELDFKITSGANPTEWEIYSQPYPHPGTAYLRWWIGANGRIEYLDTPARVLVQTNTYVAKDVWHHSRTVVDVFNDRTEIYLDGVLVATGTPIGIGPQGSDHGFTQITAYGAGDDQFLFDNFTVRERTVEHGLTVDLPRMPIGVRSVLNLRLAGGASVANRSYAVLASLSGTSPGAPFGSIVLPLNVDGFFGLMVTQVGTGQLPGFLGTLNSDGNAFADFDTQIAVPAALLGLQLDFAWLTLTPIDAASEPAGVVVSQ